MNDTEIILSVLSITLVILLLISAIIILIFYSVKQRLKMQMDLAQNKLEYEKELRKVETEVSEETMKHVAQELHDNIGQLLTAANIQIESQKLDNPQLEKGFELIEKSITDASQQVRLLSRALNNDYLGNIGLLTAIEIEVDRLRSLSKFDVHYKPISGPSNLDKNQELMAFRVFQEIINNSLRHSVAKNFYISVITDNNNFELNVKDDGKGFGYESTIQSPKASGLRNIINRAQWAKLDCKIVSKPGEGCSITLKKIP